MSSEFPQEYLTAEDLNLLQDVLSKAGYTCDILLDKPSKFNVAALLLVRLFQEGVTAPADLADELVRHFGRNTPDIQLDTVSPFHRFAIQGLPRQMTGTVH